MSINMTADVKAALGGRLDLLNASLRLTKFVDMGENSGHPFKQCETWRTEERLKTDHLLAFSPPGCESFAMRLMGNLAINLAGGVVENAGMCLHRFFGSPYIPGSALKGAARHHAWLEWRDDADRGDEAAAKDLAVKIVLTFGFPTGDNGLDGFLGKLGWNSARAGGVAFLAAFPLGAAKFARDIVTCHHPKYYQGKNEKAFDDEEPTPNVFPVVKAGSSFLFSVTPLAARIPLDGFSPLAFAKEHLRGALQDQGVGAKTAAGYGWFEDDDQALESFKAKQEELRRRKAAALEFKAMPQAERDALEYLKTLPSGNLEGTIREKMRDIASLPEPEQRHVCALLKGKFREVWLADVKDAKKAETLNDKKRDKFLKNIARVNAVRPVAQKLEIELP